MVGLSSRFKLFNDQKLRETIFTRLAMDFQALGLCRPDPDVRLCLACGNIQKKSRPEIEKRFQDENWVLWDEHWLRDKLDRLHSDQGISLDRLAPRSFVRPVKLPPLGAMKSLNLEEEHIGVILAKILATLH
jgi:hypothetical protein